MIDKDLCSYLQDNYTGFMRSITELSMSDTGASPLVENAKQLYNFDGISQQFYKAATCPSSVDCINATPEEVILIEFKSGFKQKITKDTFNPKAMGCPEIKDRDFICNDYWKLFFKNQKHERKILLDALKFKAIESYLTLEKQIFSKCGCTKNNKKIPIQLLIVIDEDETENMENTLGELAKQPANKNNVSAEIKTSLKRFIQQKDCHGNFYFYNKIDVMSSIDFLNKVNAGTIPTL